ncbi:MAG TPA: methyltransferase domain-containing protein [Terriglobales bacterium]|nr:methyltransferase domain-containing protein [Terriglobales bacterium]
MSELSEPEIKAAVTRRYGQLAKSAKSETSCCASSCCTVDEKDVPKEAAAISASCGSPVALAGLKKGEVVVDLGSGGGIDVFRASKIVGDTGRVIGVDSTPEMLQRAHEVAAKYQYRNVEFRQGDIEQLPLADNSVDAVISNCVLNLVPDKTKAFREIYRVLKPNGRITISDMVANDETSKRKILSADEWAACIAGAVTAQEYKQLLTDAGFKNINITTKGSTLEESGVHSVTWSAIKLMQ